MTDTRLIRAGLMFLRAPETTADRIAFWLALAAKAEGHSVIRGPRTGPEAVGLIIDGCSLRISLFARVATGGAARMDRIPMIGSDFMSDLTDISSVVLIDTPVPDDADAAHVARRLLSWAAYQSARALDADFIQWRSPSIEITADDMLEAALPVADAPCPVLGPAPTARDWQAIRPAPARHRRRAFDPLDVGRLEAELNAALRRKVAQQAQRRAPALAQRGWRGLLPWTPAARA